MEWDKISQSLNERGYAHVRSALSVNDCEILRCMYDDPALFRSTINMERYQFGKGEYKYFGYPLPAMVTTLRAKFYPNLAKIANEWMERLCMDLRFPPEHERLLDQCHKTGQTRPTPLVLRYETGGYNSLHQDLYGEVYFPFQVVFLLSRKGLDFTGGDFVLTEQIPRAQPKVKVLQPDAGDAVIFTTKFRPLKGKKGYYRAAMKHGISEVESGVRYAMGIIFHDAL